MRKKHIKIKHSLNLAHKKIHSPFFTKLLLLFIIAATLILGALTLVLTGKIFPEKFCEKKENPNAAFEQEIRSIVKDYPIESMSPYISQKNRAVAAFMIGIAKKESDWGKHVPVLNGRDCYNYWGYRDQSNKNKVTWDGYTCFKNPRQAVNVVSNRINELIQDSNLDTPQEMKVWKCGWTCENQDPESVDKWISDVNYYFKKFY